MKSLNLIQSVNESIKTIKSLSKNSKEVDNAINLIFRTLKQKKKIFICGNGGSASQAEHFSTEFLVRLNPKVNRAPIPAISLATDVSTILACGNDFSFNKVFSRNLKALGAKNDILIVISTSGKSKNILDVLKTSRKKKIFSIGFFGNGGGEAKKITDLSLIVKSKNVARIQEAHILLGHYIFDQVEKKILKKINGKNKKT